MEASQMIELVDGEIKEATVRPRVHDARGGYLSFVAYGRMSVVLF
jgi:hypothetical protein